VEEPDGVDVCRLRSRYGGVPVVSLGGRAGLGSDRSWCPWSFVHHLWNSVPWYKYQHVFAETRDDLAAVGARVDWGDWGD